MGDALDNFLVQLARPVSASDARGSTDGPGETDAPGEPAGEPAATGNGAVEDNALQQVAQQAQQAAALNESTVPIAETMESQATKGQNCYWHPFCKFKATQCGGCGKRDGPCSFMKAKYTPDKMPTEEALMEKKLEARRERNRNRMREKRAKIPGA